MRRIDMARIDSVIRCQTDELSMESFQLIQENLTLRYKKSEEVVELWTYDADTQEVTLPRSMAHLFADGLEDKMSDGRALEWDPSMSKLVPREGQQEAINVLVRVLQSEAPVGADFRHAVLDADCGLGKTVMAAEAGLRVGRSMVVLVHKDFLAQQWVEAFHGNDEWGGLWPEAKIGHIQRDRCDSGEDFDVVIASIASLLVREYDPRVFSTFGTLIGDEVHRYGAGQWQKGLRLFPARRRVGLTATWWRYDGMLPVIQHHIGDPTHEMRREGADDARVHFVKVSTYLERKAYMNPWDGKLNRSKLVSALANDEGRNRYIAGLIDKALGAGRKCIVLSERRAQLDTLEHTLISKGWVGKCGYYVGGQSQEALDAAAEKQCVLATYQMAKEGLDIPKLDTLFIATPIADVVQSVGRIMRSHREKKEPVVVDFVDSQVGPCVGFASARRAQYEKLGFDIE